MLLYCAYQAQCDALAPVRFFADAARGLLVQPWPGIGALPLMRGAAAALNLFSHTRLSHERAPFGIDRVTVDGAKIAVSEEVVAVHPFCRLLHFRKAAALDQPKLLMVAPLSGHFATLLRGTIAAALPDHDLYVTDWLNARGVSALGPGIGGGGADGSGQRSLPASLDGADGRADRPHSQPDRGQSLRRIAFARLVREHGDHHGAGALSRRLPPRLSRLSAAGRVPQHEPRPPYRGALADVPPARRRRGQ